MTDRQKGRTHDPGEILRAYRLIVGEGNVTELRALEATTAHDRYPRTICGYFDSAEALAAAVGEIRTAKGVYFIPNAVNPDLLARCCNRIKQAGKGDATQDSDITARRWLLIDADPIRPAGISSSDTEHAAALERIEQIAAGLQSLGWPDPIKADSGNGAHALYRIDDLPADDGGIVTRCLQALAAQHDDAAVKVDQTTFNPARIWKLYGTLACKGDDVPGRPYRMARIIDAPDNLQTVPRDRLEQLAGEAPAENNQAVHTTHAGGERFDVADFIRRNGLEVDGPHDWPGLQGMGQKWTFKKSPMCECDGDGPYIVQHASGAVTAGCHHDHCHWTWQDLRQRYEPRDTRPVDLAGIDKQATGDNGRPENPQATKPQAEPRDTPAPVERFRPYPVRELPQPLRGFVAAGAESIGCDPSYLAMPLLTICGAAIGNTRRLILKRGWAACPVLWTAIVGESGTSKSPAFRLVMRPVRERQRRAMETHAEEMREHERDLARWERDIAKWKKEKGDTDPPDRPEQPPMPRFVVSDTTIEALAPLLLANARGLLLARDELAGWLGSFDRYTGKGGGDSAHWLSMHNAESIIVDRKTGSPRTIYVPSAAVSITGGIQPGILHRALGIEHRESGLAARLLVSCPPRQPKRWSEQDIDAAAEQAIEAMLDRLYSLQSEYAEDGHPRPVVIGMAGDAKQVWLEHYARHAEEQADMGGDLAAAWSKLEELPARLALILHCTRRRPGDPDRVDADTMTRAVVLTEWHKHETRRVYGLLGESDEAADTRRLVEWIDRRGGAVTVRDLQQGRREFKTAADAEATLQTLVKAGLGTWQDVPAGTHGGRPTRVFQLSTVSTVYTTPESPEENGGSVDVDSVDAQKHTTDGRERVVI